MTYTAVDNPEMLRALGGDLLLYDLYVSSFDDGFGRTFALYSETGRMSDGITITRCGSCAALTFDLVEHVEWHEMMRREMQERAPKFGLDWTCIAHGDSCTKSGLDWDCSQCCAGGVYPGPDGRRHSMKCRLVNEGEQL
jgi:hypothetical protein